jgi:hypothetical protein
MGQSLIMPVSCLSCNDLENMNNRCTSDDMKSRPSTNPESVERDGRTSGRDICIYACFQYVLYIHMFFTFELLGVRKYKLMHLQYEHNNTKDERHGCMS